MLLPRKNGFEVCFDIKRTERGRDTPVLLMSAIYKDVAHAEGYAKNELGAQGFLVKPFELSALLSRVRSLIGDALPARVGLRKEARRGLHVPAVHRRDGRAAAPAAPPPERQDRVSHGASAVLALAIVSDWMGVVPFRAAFLAPASAVKLATNTAAWASLRLGPGRAPRGDGQRRRPTSSR